MTFHPPTAFIPPRATDRHSPPSMGDFPSIETSTCTSSHTVPKAISYASRVSASPKAEKSSSIPPIGTERTSPTKTTQTKLFVQNGAATETRNNVGIAMNGGLSLNSDTANSLYDSSPATEGFFPHAQYLYRHLNGLQNDRQQVRIPSSYWTQLEQQNYTEEIARYFKTQQDELALRHAEDLAAGRAQPSGEGGFHPPPGPSDPANTTVFVGGLHHNVTEPELYKFFQPFGQISYVKIPPGKGCGFVQYVEKRCAELALERMQGFMLNGCKIRLSWGKTGTDKVSRSQDAQMRAVAALQGLSSMSPEFLEKLGFAMELVNNEPLFRQMITIHDFLLKQNGGMPLDDAKRTAYGPAGVHGSDLYFTGGTRRGSANPYNPASWQSARSDATFRTSHQASTPQDDPLYGFSPFSPAASPASTAWKPPANLLDDHELTAGTPSGRSYRTSDDDDSPTSASTGPITPGLPSSLSSTRSSGSVPALLSSSSRSHSDVSPSSGSYKFEHAYGLSPANSHTINDAQLFDAFASSLPSQDYSRPVGSHSSRGSLQFGTSTDTLRSHALSNSNLPAQLDLQMGGLNISRDDKAPRSFHPFGLAFSPISPIDGRR